MRYFFLAGLILSLALGFSQIAHAGNASDGKTIFVANCASCHAKGGNIVKQGFSLNQADLSEKLANYTSNPEGAIIKQVTFGKNAMPAFRGRLKPSQIEDVAAYVAQQAAQGWK